MKRSSLALVLWSAATLCSPHAAAQQDFSKASVRVEQLSPTTFMISGEGGNLGVSVGPDAVFVIDDQYAPMATKLKAAIARLTKRPIDFVFNTHWHGDHTGGNESMGKAGALIVAHEQVRKRLSADGLIAFLGMKTKAQPKAALPVVTFTQDITFHINGDEVHAYHVPHAHTDGDAIVHFKNSNVIHMGDIFFNKSYPFIDTSSGGTVRGVLQAVDRALATVNEDTKIIPGHGPLASKADLQAYRDMLAAVSERIDQQIKAKKTLQDIVALKPTAPFDAVWGGGFLPPDKWVEMLYDNLRQP
ncbi:MAG TPA: MBL fold metallo-hydrolase [Burkholderiaceae bacterium]|nr:MBL fold metallo-hydrolase [Burkholderiaceae bacterium]